MDYCIPCNRTLNGAVTCPECGAFDSGMTQPSERRDGAPAVDGAMPEVLFNGDPGSSESPFSARRLRRRTCRRTGTTARRG